MPTAEWEEEMRNRVQATVAEMKKEKEAREARENAESIAAVANDSADPSTPYIPSTQRQEKGGPANVRLEDGGASSNRARKVNSDAITKEPGTPKLKLDKIKGLRISVPESLIKPRINKRQIRLDGDVADDLMSVFGHPTYLTPLVNHILRECLSALKNKN